VSNTSGSPSGSIAVSFFLKTSRRKTIEHNPMKIKAMLRMRGK
jgi:hypothetical protein